MGQSDAAFIIYPYTYIYIYININIQINIQNMLKTWPRLTPVPYTRCMRQNKHVLEYDIHREFLTFQDGF